MSTIKYPILEELLAESQCVDSTEKVCINLQEIKINGAVIDAITSFNECATTKKSNCSIRVQPTSIVKEKCGIREANEIVTKDKTSESSYQVVN